jgi:hypothetical protein
MNLIAVEWFGSWACYSPIMIQPRVVFVFVHKLNYVRDILEENEFHEDT